MDEVDKLRIRLNYVSLVNDLRVQEIFPCLIQDGILTNDDKQRIERRVNASFNISLNNRPSHV